MNLIKSNRASNDFLRSLLNSTRSNNASVRLLRIFLILTKLLLLDFLPAAELAKSSPKAPPGFVFTRISIMSGGDMHEVVTVF